VKRLVNVCVEHVATNPSPPRPRLATIQKFSPYLNKSITVGCIL
jgi:hypothetical protein